MASKKKRKGMVFLQDGATAPAAASAANHPPACSIPNPGKASESGMEQMIHVMNKGVDIMGKTNIYPLNRGTETFGGLAVVKHPISSKSQSDNLPPDSICKSIKVTLDNNSMWNEFFRCKTEMILTKQGSRMFPYCRFHISGLHPSRKYSLIMDIQPLDNSCYKWTGKSWQVAGKAECHVKSQPFAHPDSPSMGQHWMQNPVSFYKLKLTNNILDQEGNTILHPMHRYLPRLHLVQSDKAAKDIRINGPNVVTFTFPQTEFIAVMAYQNSRFSQLKVDYNPFAKGLKEDGSSSWGLKLKLNSSKDSHKDRDTTTNEQHPVKKSLKSLLANHKPRTSKAVDSKLSVLVNTQNNSIVNKEEPTAKVSREGLCSSRPAPKLFSDLIREAHVSLQRCNVEQLRINNSASYRTEQTNTKTVGLKSNTQDVQGQKDSTSFKASDETSPAKKSETIKKRTAEDSHQLNVLNCKDPIITDCSEVSSALAAPAMSQNSSVDLDQKFEPKAPSELNLRSHRRLVPLPLPALALFLKRHSSKTKKTKSKPDSSSAAMPPELLSVSQSSAAISPYLPCDPDCNATGPSKSLTGDVPKSDSQADGTYGAVVYPAETVLNVTGEADEKVLQPSSLSCPNAVSTTDSIGSRTEGPALAQSTLVVPISDQPLCTLQRPTSIISSSPTNTSVFSILPPPITALPDSKSPQTPAITESSTLPSDSLTIKSESLLPDPECSSLGFEPLSPASSPEPLPTLPSSLGLVLDSTISGPALKATEDSQQSKVSTASVFKWHTVLPPSEPYIDPFQPTSPPLLLPSITPPFLASQTSSNAVSQSLHTSTPSADSAPSFEENEQCLPFPAELSPLALQLPLSPTFSSLDGDGLSPTPSLADLVHFFSTDDVLGMGVEFSNTEPVAVPCSTPSTAEANAHGPSQLAQTALANKACKRKKQPRRQKLAKMDVEPKVDNSSYTRMQPNLEEVEEQLFISFTSKEALRLHIAESEEMITQTTPEVHLQPAVDTPKNDTAESLEERISAFEKILLQDLKLMKHRQVIHPVLQEVGLKMNLLDPTLAIDLQYLGVRLPIPSLGVSLDLLTQEQPPPQGVPAAYVSRTGKTTDVTQIKGWREKFTPSEAPFTPSSGKPEAGPSSDPPKKNLSAFCSDMLDEYLENEGKLIDERAASFSQPQVEPVVYELPTRSTSYVRTLDSVLKKQPGSSPTADLISGFIPPSRRPKLLLKEKKASRKGDRKPKGPKQNKQRPEDFSVSTPDPSPTKPNLLPKLPSAQTPAVALHSEHSAHVSRSPKSKKNLKVQINHTEPLSLSSQTPSFKRRRKLKPKSSSQTLSPSRSTAPPAGVFEEMAPLESDSELGDIPSSKESRPIITRALLRQKDLENGVVWEGRPRTCITEERASIALTSLFTLMGFVSENPTAPIQLVRRQAPPCMNEFCRLGCICSSLSHRSRNSHCGQPQCMFGCSCLKQKVVLLKNLDGSDSSPSHQENNTKRGRKRRMKMAYVLKDADSVSQPAERVRTLWKRDRTGTDPEPVHVPELGSLPLIPENRESDSSCARVRGYTGKKMTKKQKKKEKMKNVKTKAVRLKSLMHSDLKLKKTKTKPSIPPPDEPVQPGSSKQAPGPPTELPPKLSKRLIILAECKWASDADRNHVLKTLCEAMAQDRLANPFWIKKYLISPLSQTVEENSTQRCIQYKIHISTPKVEREKPAAPAKPPQQRGQEGGMKLHQPLQDSDTKPKQLGRDGGTKQQQGQDVYTESQRQEESIKLQSQVQKETKPQQQQEQLRQVNTEARSPEEWQQEVMEEEEPLEGWQRELEEDELNNNEVDGEKEKSKEKMKAEETKMNNRGLPFLTGISPAGFLSANRKTPGGTDHLVQVNGKLYPLAKIQLGKMGALHPANRLAAYLTGRVGSNKSKKESSSSSGPPPTSGLTLQTISSASSVLSNTTTSALPRPQPSVLNIPTSSIVLQADKLAAGEAPKGVETRLISVSVYTNPAVGGSRVVPAASDSSVPTDSQVKTSVVRPVNPKGSQVFTVEVLGSLGKPPVPGAASQAPASPSTGQRVVLQPVNTASGVQYYRKSDGRLVQLVPINHLRSVNTNLPLHGGPSSPSVLPPPRLQTPGVTVVNSKLPQTTVTTTSTSISSVSGLQSLSASPTPALIHPGPSFLAQKGTCTFKILPASANKDPIVITCPNAPSKAPGKVVPAPSSFTLLQPNPSTPLTPVNLISLKPSPGLGLGVKTLTVSAVPVGTGRVSVPQKPASSQSCTTQIPTETSHRPLPPQSDITPSLPPPANRSGPELELACNLVDLDIICVDNETMEVVDVRESSSSETENSSDFDSDNDEEKEPISMNPRLLHNVLERKRRVQMKQLFEGLRTELGQSQEKTSKISTLEKAVQVIQELKMSERHLERTKRRLKKQRDEYLSTITPTTDKSSQDNCRAQRPITRCKKQADIELMEVVDLLEEIEEAEEPTHNSSDKGRVSIITNDEDNEVQPVALEMEENIHRNTAHRRLAMMTSSKKIVEAPIETDIYKALGSVLNTDSSSKTHLLEQAHEEIQTLQTEMKRLENLKMGLNQHREAYITEISQRSGKSKQRVLRKLQHMASKQKKKEKQDELPAPAGSRNSEPSPTGCSASEPLPPGETTNDDFIITSSNLQHQNPATLTSVFNTTPVQQSQMGQQLSNLVLAPPAPVLRDKPRTIPNILSRSKNSAPPASVVTSAVEGDAPSFQALVPTEVLSLVGATLPGQQVLTLSPLIAAPTVLQTTSTPGVASVTLNIPRLTSQPINLASMPQPPAGKIYSCSSPLTITNLTAANFTNLLHLLQPATTQQLQQLQLLPQQQTQLQQLQQPLEQQHKIQHHQPHHQQQVPVGQDPPPPPTPPSVVVPARSDQVKDQDYPPFQTPIAPVLSSPHSTEEPSSSACLGLSVKGRSEVSERGAVVLDQQENRDQNCESQSLTSLLSEIVFLNQQQSSKLLEGVSSPGKLSPEVDTGEGGVEPHSPWFLQLDSDSDDPVNTETEQVGFNGPQTGPVNGNGTNCVLAPPPLLQMNGGGAKVTDPIGSNTAAEGGGASREGGVAWRPMPRLVPLGLRGNQTS
ncbi:MAX dimerization protein MGA a isoform X2 [Channa argus]|uniref:MAX dimerization protein MGA a isoform X2 n=1 Tax=Channa argus TaxID=215402 RepID=UPI003522CA68